MIKPNFFIVGAPKCGTTTVADWLRKHPEVFIPMQKEPHHFNKDHKFNVYESYNDYISLFQTAKGAKAIGEASVWYLYSEVAIKEIEKTFPDSKYIVCLRSPVQMAHSLYWEQVFATNEDVKSFSEAWTLSDKRADGERVVRHCREPKHLDYKRACMLGFQVGRLLEAVSRDRVLFVFLEDLSAHPNNVYEELISFLDVSTHALESYQPSNSFKKVRWRPVKLIVRYLGFLRQFLPIKKSFGILNFLNASNKKQSSKPVIDSQLESAMKIFFKDDVHKLASLTGRRLDSWLE